MLNGSLWNINWAEFTAGLRVSDPLRDIAEGIRREARRLAHRGIVWWPPLKLTRGTRVSFPLPPSGEGLMSAVRGRDPLAVAKGLRVTVGALDLARVRDDLRDGAREALKVIDDKSRFPKPPSPPPIPA